MSSYSKMWAPSMSLCNLLLYRVFMVSHMWGGGGGQGYSLSNFCMQGFFMVNHF
jgi:hypothetical protein